MENFQTNVGTLLIDNTTGAEERIIAVVNGYCITIRCDSTKAIFSCISLSELCLDLKDKKKVIAEDQKSYVLEPEKLPDKVRESYERKRNFINEVERLFDPDYQELFSKKSKPEFTKLVSKYGFSNKHALTIVRTWLQGGMQNSSLADPRYVTGRKNSLTLNYSKKTGRPSDTGILLDDHAAEAFDYGFKQYMGGRLVTVKDAYLDMVALFYSNPKAGEQGEYIMLPKNQRPTYDQFYYHLRKHYSKEEIEKKKTSDREYRNDKRPLGGKPSDDAMRPGDILEADALEADIYVVSNHDRSQLIGRPVVYMMVDEYSHCVVAASVKFDNNSNLALSSLMINLFEDKDEAAKRIGVSIDKTAWPSGFKPHEIRCDRGSDFAGDYFLAMCNDLNIRRVLEEPGFGSMKGTVEQTFRQFQQIFKREFENKGYIQKRHDSTHLKNACITIDEFACLLYLFIVYHNTRISRTLDLSKDMIMDGVPAIPIKVWEYGEMNYGKPRYVSEAEKDNVFFRLMPKDKASINRAGIFYKGLYYKVVGDPELLVRISFSTDNAYMRGEEGNKLNSMEIRYDPRSVNCLYYESHGTVKILYLNTSKSNSFRDMTWKSYLEIRKMKSDKDNLLLDYTVNMDIERRRIVKGLADSVNTGKVSNTGMRKARKQESEQINFANALENIIGQKKEEPLLVENPVEDAPPSMLLKGPAPATSAFDQTSSSESKDEEIDLTAKSAPKTLRFKRKSILSTKEDK